MTAPAVEVALDISKNATVVAPLPIAVAFLIGGVDAGLAVVIGLLLVVSNFLISAYILGWASKISGSLVASTSVSSYFFRISSIGAIVWLLKDVDSVNLIWLTFTLVISHLGLLFWELQFVSATIAYPGLKPKAAGHKPAAGYTKELL